MSRLFSIRASWILLCLPLAPGAAGGAFVQEEGEGAWPQFRGPGGLANGRAAPVVTALGPEKGVVWRASLPTGHSSPCIHGDRVFVTGFEHGRELVIALDRENGAEVWRRAFVGPPHPHYEHVHAVPALSTPCTDGARVCAYVANYGLVCLDRDGDVVWERRLPHPGYGFGVGTSPILVGDRVILARDGAPEAAVLAFALADGTDAWRIERADCIEAHGTPFLWRNQDREELILGGTGRVAAHDPRTGAPLWSVSGVTLFACTTPTADADTLYFAAWSTPNATGRSFWEAGFGQSLDVTDAEVAEPGLLFDRLDANRDGRVEVTEVPPTRAKDAFGFVDKDGNGAWDRAEFIELGARSGAPGENVLVAIARGGSGDVTATHVRWRWTKGLPYVASPLLHQGRVWLVKAGGGVTVLDAASGACLVDRARLEDRCEYYMSPVSAGEFVLAGSADGALYVMRVAGEAFELVHTARFPEALFSTPAILDGRVYLRTANTLYAFGA